MNKTTLFISSIILALSSFITATTFATSHEKAEEAEVECVTQAALAEMSDEDKANLTAPMCEGDEGEDQSEDKEAPKAD